ncbi:MAG: hypothetical protein FWE40_00290 [Oscillospiraceae bacterium]|nr:hypothetical protein [Oscillospiraceae bacterium]
MDLRIYLIVGSFMFACIALMVFNFVIMRVSREKSASSADKSNTWQHILATQALAEPGKAPCLRKHDKLLLKKLGDAQNLVAYGHALQKLKDEHGDEYLIYMRDRHHMFYLLAQQYFRKASVDRACFADFVCDFPQVTDGAYETLVSTLVACINDPSVHCRTNALRALCSVGNVRGVVNALQTINDRSLFVHHQLLTNELLSFSGNKEDLGEQLWKENAHWNDGIRASVAQFIADASKRRRKASSALHTACAATRKGKEKRKSA